MPIIEPEVNIKSAERDAADRDPAATKSCRQLDGLPDGEQVMLKLSIPDRGGSVRSRWSIIPRSCASSLCRADSRAPMPCRDLARNPGMIASFSRALLSDLRHQMSDERIRPHARQPRSTKFISASTVKQTA